MLIQNIRARGFPGESLPEHTLIARSWLFWLALGPFKDCLQIQSNRYFQTQGYPEQKQSPAGHDGEGKGGECSQCVPTNLPPLLGSLGHSQLPHSGNAPPPKTTSLGGHARLPLFAHCSPILLPLEQNFLFVKDFIFSF